jgi:tungstate transport system ATP-binding protein
LSALYRLTGIRVARGGRTVLDVDDLVLEDGGITALVGPNGAGKSTLLEVLAFLLTPGAGRLAFDGMAVSAANMQACARRVGLVSQNPYLLDRSVAANVRLGLSLRGVSRQATVARVEDALDRLGLAALAERHVRQLSGGEAQKVAIARMVALRPDVLLLDEPFSYLDSTATAELAALIADPSQLGARKIVFTTHDELLALKLAANVVNVVAGRADRGSLLNLYSGRLDHARHSFDTGRLVVHVGDHVTDGTRIALDPAHVVLSSTRLESSMRNVFPGRITSLVEHGGEVLVTVDAGLRIHALVTHDAVLAQRLQPGAATWVSFKSNAVRVF